MRRKYKDTLSKSHTLKKLITEHRKYNPEHEPETIRFLEDVIEERCQKSHRWEEAYNLARPGSSLKATCFEHMCKEHTGSIAIFATKAFSVVTVFVN